MDIDPSCALVVSGKVSSIVPQPTVIEGIGPLMDIEAREESERAIGSSTRALLTSTTTAKPLILDVYLLLLKPEGRSLARWHV